VKLLVNKKKKSLFEIIIFRNLGTYLPLDRINPFLCQLLTYPPKIFSPNEIVFEENNKRSTYVFYPYSKRLHNKFARHFTHYNSRTNHIFTIGKIIRFFSF
jgi:ribosomal protein S17E